MQMDRMFHHRVVHEDHAHALAATKLSAPASEYFLPSNGHM